jgi:D-arabinose 1-dehydrogenase-like Zn-dependent alcohol dehydrogenase
MTSAHITRPTQRAVELVGADELELDVDKPIPTPGDRQILARVEAVGLCYSDVKLLRQFDKHPRKSMVVAGIEADALAAMPHYVPGLAPTVPGHEAVVRIVECGSNVASCKPGDRVLVQTDYRWLPTAKSNAAFGYNFEGALQDYVLFDERVTTAPDGSSMLMQAPETLSASAVALCEPWACVEDAYCDEQRRVIDGAHRTLVVFEGEGAVAKHASVAAELGGAETARSTDVSSLADGAYDNVVYFGAVASTAECLFPKLADRGLFVIVTDGEEFGRPVTTPVGRIHYGGIRLAGTRGGTVAEALASVPVTAALRENDRVQIVGAAGPMGTMHAVRAICSGLSGIRVDATDLSAPRLDALRELLEPLARDRGVDVRLYTPEDADASAEYDYIVVLVPSPELIANAVERAAPHAVINIFAGIAADVCAPIDLDRYIARRCYFVGTSGSAIEDMRTVLAKVAAEQLDTNLSVVAVGGLEGAIDGIRAVERNAFPGKIIIYPACRGLKLTAISELEQELPIQSGRWSKQAEDALLRRFGAA